MTAPVYATYHVWDPYARRDWGKVEATSARDAVKQAAEAQGEYLFVNAAVKASEGRGVDTRWSFQVCLCAIEEDPRDDSFMLDWVVELVKGPPPHVQG